MDIMEFGGGQSKDECLSYPRSTAPGGRVGVFVHQAGGAGTDRNHQHGRVHPRHLDEPAHEYALSGRVGNGQTACGLIGLLFLFGYVPVQEPSTSPARTPTTFTESPAVLGSVISEFAIQVLGFSVSAEDRFDFNLASSK